MADDFIQDPSLHRADADGTYMHPLPGQLSVVGQGSAVPSTPRLQAMQSLNSAKCRNFVAGAFRCTGKADRLLREARMVRLAKDAGSYAFGSWLRCVAQRRPRWYHSWKPPQTLNEAPGAVIFPSSMPTPSLLSTLLNDCSPFELYKSLSHTPFRPFFRDLVLS
jgi:hypothetical protein